VYLLFKKPLGSCRDHKYNLIYRPEHPSKSNAIGRCGGDENTKRLRRTDHVESKTIQNRTGHNKKTLLNLSWLTTYELYNI